MSADIEMLISAIGSVGFPILACCYMWKFINTAMSNFTKTIESNTKMLEQIYKKLGGDIDE